MALRRIQDLSSYNLSAIRDIFIPVAALIGVSSYRVQKITPDQILNTVFDSIEKTPIKTIYVDAPSANILNLSSSNILTTNISSDNVQVGNISATSIVSLSINTSSILANTGGYIDLKGVSISGYSLNINSLSTVSASGDVLSFNDAYVTQLSASSLTAVSANLTNTNIYALSAYEFNTNKLSALNASVVQISTNNLTAVDTNLTNVSAYTLSAYQLTATSARFNGYLPAAKYSYIINHQGSLEPQNYIIQQPFEGLEIITQLARINITNGLSSAEVVFASITNNGDKSFTVNILEPNDSVFQITFIS